ncbi:MAG: flavin reductase [Angelakisella sp.]
MVDMKAFFKMSYGLYLISSKDGDRDMGCVVNTLTQVTVEPPQVVVALHKDNNTTKAIQKSGCFTGVALAETATMELIGQFGFHSSLELDKFAPFASKVDEHGVRYVTEQVAARYSCKVVGSIDTGTHIVFVGEVTTAEILDPALAPMTYAYYHQVKNGATPPRASSYKPEEQKKGYRCKICGYILESDTLPADFICPICHKGAEFFEKL